MELIIKDSVLEECKLKEDETDVVIPDGVTEIGGYAFNGCTGLHTVVIPESVNVIGYGAFYGCSNLEKIVMSSAAISEIMFFPSSKMVALELTDIGDKPVTVMGLFRKEYYSQTWDCEKSCLIPTIKEDVILYDRVLACGSSDGFTTNEDGRIIAMIWRSADKNTPVSSENLNLFRDFLASKITKTVKLAVKNNAEKNIETLVAIQVINSDNEKKVIKLLEKSEDKAVLALAGKLNSMISGTVCEPTVDESVNGLEEKFHKPFRELKVKSIIGKYGIVIPDVQLASKAGNAPKGYLEFVIAQYLSKCEISHLADEAAKKMDRESLKSALMSIYDNIGNVKQKAKFLAPLFRYADGADVNKLYKAMVNKYNEYEMLYNVMLSDTREAMLIVDKAQLLSKYAEMRGTTADAIRDRFMSDVGLDENGTKVYDLGSQSVTVKMLPDFTFSITTSDGKTVKSIPKKGSDEAKYTEASKIFTELKKTVKSIVSARQKVLFDDFLNGTTRKAEEWISAYQNNPILRQVASLIVWSQGKSTFTLNESGAIKSNGAEYKIGKSPIAVAHPMEMEESDVKAWQKYFSDKKLKQPFLQVWEPVADAALVKSDRYDGIEIPFNFFRGSEKHGIHIEDYDFHNEISIDMPDCAYDTDFTVWHRHELPEKVVINNFRIEKLNRRNNHIIALLDRWTVTKRIADDDTSIFQFIGNATLAQLTYYIDIASQNNATNCMAELLELKNKNYPDFDPMDEYSLD